MAKKSAPLSYSTSIDYYKTIAEIFRILAQHKAQGISTENNRDGIPITLRFTYVYCGTTLVFAMPIRHENILRRLKSSTVPSKLKTEEQAIRIGWRVMLNWLKVQMELVENEQTTVTEIFLSYLQTSDGELLHDKLLGTRHDNYNEKSEKATKLLHG